MLTGPTLRKGSAEYLETRMQEPRVTRSHIVVLVVMLFLTTLGQGCSTNVNRKAFESCHPRNIGIVLGYDLHSVSRSSGEEFLVAALFGVVGTVANELAMDRPEVKNNSQVNGIVMDKITSQLEAKGYSTRVLTTRNIEYNTFENSGGKPEDFDRLVQKYDVAAAMAEVDAILFVEGFLEFRFHQPAPGEVIAPNKIQTRAAEMKLSLFDRNTGQLLFKRFSALIDVYDFNRVCNNLIQFDKIPGSSN